MPEFVAITQARMNSTRLPGKIMAEIEGRPLLEWHLERVRQASSIDAVAVASPDSPSSAPIAALCRRAGVAFFAGPEEDVLERYWLAATALEARHVVRVTSDNPLLDPALIDALISQYSRGDADYVAIDMESAKGGYPYGMAAEVFSAAILAEARARATTSYEREHVTPYIYNRPERFRIAKLGGGRGAHYRITVDEPADLERVRKLVAALPDKKRFGWRDVVDLLEQHPEWSEPTGSTATPVPR